MTEKKIPLKREKESFSLSKETLISEACKLHMEGNIIGASRCYENILSKGYKDPVVYANYGLICKQNGKINKAIEIYCRSINEYPNNPQAYYNLGNLYKDIGKLTDALNFTQKAININPKYVQAYSNLGVILKELGNLEEAEISVRKAINLDPKFVDSYLNLGCILIDLRQLDEAYSITKKVISMEPHYAIAYNNLGSVLKELGNLLDAKKFVLKAIQLNPELDIAYANLGEIMSGLGEFKDAAEYYKKSLSINSKSSFAKAGLLKILALICDWPSFEKYYNWIGDIGLQGDGLEPLSFIAYEDSPLKNLIRAENYSNKILLRQEKNIHFTSKSKIRIGYFSSDFFNHATMYLFIRILELHDHSRFQVYAYDYGHNKKDNISKKVQSIVDYYYDISKISDKESVRLARSHNLDIAIDLKGITKDSRLSLFAHRLAPIQITYLGFPGSTGLKQMDYIIADEIVIPKNNKKFFSEKVLYMPNCYQCNDDTKTIDRGSHFRSNYGLPHDGFIFSCFNANFKIKAREFDIWMSLLNKIDNSFLWLYKSNYWSELNIRKEALIRGVDDKRLIFADKLPLSKHLARHLCSDLALDTFNYNGHTTTSDALWAGLPVITKIGQSFAARVSASLLHNLGLSELITYTDKEYEDLALYLATHHDQLFKLKVKLADSIKSTALFNSTLFVKDLEKMFNELVCNHQS